MSNKSIELNENLYEYLLNQSLREPPILKALREETVQLEMARMQIAPEQGQFMAFLLKLMGAKKYLEVGTFTGYSALVSALAMPESGRVVALDISEEWTTIAKRYWQDAGVSERIQLRLGDATATLKTMLPSEAGQFDFMFIDADKTGYRAYIDLGWQLVRQGGLIALDNTLWGGRVADSADRDEDTVAIRQINSSMLADQRFDLSLVPIGDGLTLLRKR